jgi:hypothetical protein
VVRYRLRFHLQEVDLQPGTTYIGRSDECEVTIEDPLVSRRHARIVFQGDLVTLEDLESRNGIRVNGKPVKGSQKLVDGDRVRIGSQDFVFCLLKKIAGMRPRTTGVLRLCGQCNAPYARELISCPNCGASDERDEATLSGTFGPEAQHSWSMQLLLAALQKALDLGRFTDADRILRRATALLEERVAAGGTIEPAQLDPLAIAAARICLETRDPSWGAWIPSLYVQAGATPPADVVERLIVLRLRHEELEEPIEHLLAHCRRMDASRSEDDRDALQRLARAHRGNDAAWPSDRPTASDPLHIH